MNIYDFDGTICYPDCSVNFAIYVMNHHPHLWITFFPKAAWNLLRYKLGKMTRAKMMLKFFTILRVRDCEQLVERYWDTHQKNISAWYLAQKRPDDLIISGSPSLLIGPIARRLGVRYVATEYDREFGVLTDNLMFAKGKSRYIIDQGFPKIENFYSDSLADTPIALCAEHAYLVTHKAQQVEDWPRLDPETMKKVHKKINTGWNIHI